MNATKTNQTPLAVRLTRKLRRPIFGRWLWSVAGNKRWGQYFQDWLNQENAEAHYGDDWGDPESELRSVLEDHLKPYVGSRKNILEIGPGGGRWTQYMLPCEKLYLVELNDEFFPYLQKRFSEYRGILQFVRTSGSDLPGVPDSSIDFVFSFDTFVHLERRVIHQYLSEIRRVLKCNGVGVIHHADEDKSEAVHRSNMTPKIMKRLVEEAGLTLIRQESVPTDFHNYDEDCITVFQKHG